MTTNKALSNVQIKDAEKGIVTAVISTFGVIDLDGDVTAKSSFKDGTPVVISAYGHTSWKGALPYGTGTIRTTDSECIFEGKFLLDTTHGRDAFLSVKGISDAGLQQWSYSLDNTVAHKGMLGGRSANFIDSTDVIEVSPVLKGASVDTRTLQVKTENLKFSEQADAALSGIREFVEMAVERLALRAAEGKSFDEQISAHDQLLTELAPLKTAIDAASTPATPPIDVDELQRIALCLVASSQGALT